MQIQKHVDQVYNQTKSATTMIAQHKTEVLPYTKQESHPHTIASFKYSGLLIYIHNCHTHKTSGLGDTPSIDKEMDMELDPGRI